MIVKNKCKIKKSSLGIKLTNLLELLIFPISILAVTLLGFSVLYCCGDTAEEHLSKYQRYEKWASTETDIVILNVNYDVSRIASSAPQTHVRVLHGTDYVTLVGAFGNVKDTLAVTYGWLRDHSEAFPHWGMQKVWRSN